MLKLKKNLTSIVKSGFALDDQEFEIGVWSAAAPIHDSSGDVVAGVAVIAPSPRINRDRLRKLVNLTSGCARDISREMGYQK